jgi:hypothetical protein
MPSAAELRSIATQIQGNRMPPSGIAEAIYGVVDGMPQGRDAVNIIDEDAQMIRTDDTYMSPTGVASLQLSAKQEKDRRAVEAMINTRGGDPRTLTATQLAMFKEMTGVKAVAPTISDLTEFSGTSTESLGSSRSIDTATLAQIKKTFQVNPDLAPLLVNMNTGENVNYNDLTRSENIKASSSKVFIGDTNINEIFRIKFGSGIQLGRTPARPNKTGLGFVIRPNMMKMKVGRGIAVKETPSYREYGKYAIHLPQLEQQDTLNVKYKSLGQIPKFKPMAVSDIFRDFILELLDNGKPNARVYTQIPTDERKFFEEMSIGAGVWNGLGLKRTTTSNDEEENKRFELLKGEYMAGNNNPKVMSDLRRLIVKMMNDGRIRKNQGVDLLMELSI